MWELIVGRARMLAFSTPVLAASPAASGRADSVLEKPTRTEAVLEAPTRVHAVLEPSARAQAVLAPMQRSKVRIEDVRARLTFFDQHGRGYQSQAGPLQGPGSERLFVVQPAASMRVRGRDERISQDITLSFDVVTAASPDALDAMSSASRTNEAGTLDLTTTIEPNRRFRVTLNYGAHLEEHWRTGFGGIGFAAGFFSESLFIAAAVNFVGDSFDPVNHQGNNPGPQEQRYALNQNVSMNAILSRTTTASLSYGFTTQWGTLSNTWNSIYVAPSTPCDPGTECGTRTNERFPKRRFRHAIDTRFHQHIPRTRTTLELGYRYYRDDFGLQAHSGLIAVYQYLIPRRLYVRAFYRAHWQTGVDFYRVSLSGDETEVPYRTADSDLGSFWAHHAGGKLVLQVRARRGSVAAPHAVSLDYSRYQRTNDLSINMISLGYSKQF